MAIQRLPFGNRIPGVQFTEEYILPAVDGSRDTITCILGPAQSGPVDPTIVYSESDFKLLFGEPLTTDYGVKAANVILPNTVMYVRVISNGARTVFKDDNVTVFTAKEGGTHLTAAELNVAVEDGVITVQLSQEGTNLETIICSANPLDSEYIFNVFDNYSTYLKLSVNEDYVFINKSLVGTGGTTGACLATASNENVEIESKYFGSRLNGVVFHLTQNINGRPYIQLRQNNVLIEEIPASSELESREDFLNRVNSTSNHINITKLEALDPVQLTLAGGDAGITNINSDDYIDALDRIADASIYRVDTLIIPGNTDNKVQTKAIKICEDRGDTIFIADHPIGLRGSLVRDFVKAQGRFSSNNALNNQYCAVFSPWVKYNDGNVAMYPPSILAANLMASNDKQFNVWDSCAGIKRGILNNIAGLEYDPTKADLNILYNDGQINPIVNLTGKGYVIWGNKTTKVPVYANAPEPICSLNVRRLINYLRKAIYDATLPFVFEANDAFTWASVRNVVCPILDTIVNNRGIDAYIFVCDETTNTSEAVDQLELNATLKIRPIRAAEFINIDLKVYPYTVEFEGGE